MQIVQLKKKKKEKENCTKDKQFNEHCIMEIKTPLLHSHQFTGSTFLTKIGYMAKLGHVEQNISFKTGT